MTSARGEAVAVVGGSAAGLYAARLLASSGRAVSVYEGAEALRPSARTLIVTSAIRDLLGPSGDAAIVNRIDHFELYADGRVATIDLDRPDFVIERSTLIRALADEAESAGARVMFGRRLKHLESNGSSLNLTFNSDRSDEAVHARTVIGADGAFSRVARAAGWRAQPTVPLVQATVRWPAGEPIDTAKVWFVPSDTPYFFWLIPESPDRGVLGLIGEDGAKAADALDRFLRKRSLQPIEFQAARIPAYRGWSPVHRRLPGGDVYLVGDAGGHVKVTTVGGLVTGFRAATGVVEKIVHGSNNELWRLRQELDIHLLIRRALHRFTQDDYVQVIDVLDLTVRQLLSRYDRDQARKLVMQLVLRRPGLMWLALRGLFFK